MFILKGSTVGKKRDDNILTHKDQTSSASSMLFSNFLTVRIMSFLVKLRKVNSNKNTEMSDDSFLVKEKKMHQPTFDALPLFTKDKFLQHIMAAQLLPLQYI